MTGNLTAKDFKSDQDVRWCPGCGDYSILANFQRVLPTLGKRPEDHVVVGGIGCSSRFPYYMATYGIHSVHGRAPAVATGIKTANPDLTVWVITGDGDGLSIGGNHLLHVLRRNVNVKILLFNNRIYGLTKGQYSPTSEPGKVTKSTPVGSIDFPVDPVRFALGAGATFVARTVDVDAKHFQSVVQRAAAHEGTAFVEILQNCPIYNDGAFAQIQDKKSRPDAALYLEQGKPLVFGANGEKALRVTPDLSFEVIDADDSAALVHDEGNARMATLLTELCPPDFPRAVGVFHSATKPTYEHMMGAQVKAAQAKEPDVSLQVLLESGETWRV